MIGAPWHLINVQLHLDHNASHTGIGKVGRYIKVTAIASLAISQISPLVFTRGPFWPLGDCRRLHLSLCLDVRSCVNNFICVITLHSFKLGSPNLDLS